MNNQQKIMLNQKPSAITVKELFDEFLRFKKLQNLSPESLSYYEDCYKYFSNYYGEGFCAEITEDIFYSYIEYINLNKPNLSISTLRS